MKRFNIRYLLTGGLAVASSFLTLCSRPAETVYGPPAETFDPETNIVEGVYGPPVGDWDPGINVPPPVYGPPPEDMMPDEEEAEADPQPGLDPAENIPETVYGPPAD